MPSKTKSRRKAAPARRPARSRRSAPRRPSRARPAAARRPSIWARQRDAAGRQLHGHGADAGAVALVVLGALLALGLFSGAAGVVGTGLADATAALVGVARYAVPFVCFGLAVLCFRARPGARRDPADRAAKQTEPITAGDGILAVELEPAPLRVGLGLVLLALAVVGALHLADGSPALERLRRLAA